MTKNISEFHSNTRNMLLDVELPVATNTYAPVAHGDIILHTLEALDKRNLQVVSENYVIGNGGKQVIGCFNINTNLDSEMNMRLMFRNSYDKSMSLAYVSGAQVIV